MVKIMRIASAAVASVKSVKRVLAGGSVRGDVMVRIEDELKRLGMR